LNPEPLKAENQTTQETITTTSAEVTTEPNLLSKDTTPSVSIQTSMDSKTIIATEHGLSHNMNTTEPNENGTITLSVNKSLSNADSYTSSPTIIPSSSKNDSKSHLTDNIIHSPTSPNASKISSTFPTSLSPLKAVSSSNDTTSFPYSSTPPTTLPTPETKTELFANKSISSNDTIVHSTTPSKSLLFPVANPSPSTITDSPITHSSIASLETHNPITQNLQNTPASFIQDSQIIPLNITQNNTIGNNVIAIPSGTAFLNKSTMQPQLENNTEVTPTVKPTGSVLITIAPIGIILLGIILLLILVCRCTPIGSWLRNRRSKKKKKIKKKIKKISKEPILMSSSDIKNEPINSGKYSLLYQEKHLPLCEVSFESEQNLKYRQTKKFMKSENKHNGEIVELSMLKNELPINEDKLNEGDPKNEIEEDELNVNKYTNKIRKKKSIKNGLAKDSVHVVGYSWNNTLNDEEKNEINVKTEKSLYENELKNSGNNVSINSEMCNWNTRKNTYIITLLEYKKEEWELIKNEFLKICIEVFEKDEKTSYLKEAGNNLIKEREEENSIVVTEKNSSILDKWKKEEWFINLKKEWKKEEEKLLEYLEEYEIENLTVEEKSNLMLDKKKKSWRKWLEKQREYSNEYKKQDWFMKLLEEYEKVGIYKNIMEEKIEKISVKKQENEINNEIDKDKMKKNLTQKMLIDIYMMVLNECKKEEMEREKDELFKTNTEGLGIQRNLDEEVNILKKIEEERSWNCLLEKKKEDIEKWKREKWFVELMLEWNENEQKYLEELNKKMLEKKNQERITNIALERQKILWKKHWDDIRKKWIENDNKEEWFTKLVDEVKSKENEYRSEITKKNIEKKKENIEIFEPIGEINRKVKEVKKYEKTHLDDTDERINYIMMKKKLMWKTIVEIHMIVLEECKKEEWMLNRGKFLEACLEEFKKEEKEKYTKKIENDLILIGEEEENISTIMLEIQKLLWKKWVERNKSMLEKWKREEWFINLKKEWENEQRNFGETIKESEIIQINSGENLMLEKQKKIWKQWLKKQRIWFIEHSEDKWFKDLLDEYKKEEEYEKELTKRDVKKIKEIQKNIKELEQEKSEEIEKSRKKKKLIQKVLIEIHMTVLEEYKKEEMKREIEGFFNIIRNEMKIQENLHEKINILEKIEEERNWNSLLEKKKEDIEKWKREKWFVELMLEWNDNEQKYLEELNKKMLEKKNQERITNIALERQKIVLKKHWEGIRKKWIENDNKEKWFTKLVDDVESKENEYRSEITKKNIEKKKENIEIFEPIVEINRKGKEKITKYENTHPQDIDEKINSIINKKKIKWKTIVEIHMIVLEECKKEEWMLNRGKFLEACLEEFKNEDKGKYTKKIENDLILIGEEEENISTIMLEIFFFFFFETYKNLCFN
ncbi:surface-associated interspersed protein (SURFIN), partial [Plasmodium gallinaceum]